MVLKMLADDPKSGQVLKETVSSGKWYFCPALKSESNFCVNIL